MKIPYVKFIDWLGWEFIPIRIHLGRCAQFGFSICTIFGRGLISGKYSDRGLISEPALIGLKLDLLLEVLRIDVLLFQVCIHLGGEPFTRDPNYKRVHLLRPTEKSIDVDPYDCLNDLGIYHKEEF